MLEVSETIFAVTSENFYSISCALLNYSQINFALDCMFFSGIIATVIS
jgi:hypothetical protein